MRNFQYNCVSPRDEEELDFIVSNYETITYETFIKNVNSLDLKDLKES